MTRRLLPLLLVLAGATGCTTGDAPAVAVDAQPVQCVAVPGPVEDVPTVEYDCLPSGR